MIRRIQMAVALQQGSLYFEWFSKLLCHYTWLFIMSISFILAIHVMNEIMSVNLLTGKQRFQRREYMFIMCIPYILVNEYSVFLLNITITQITKSCKKNIALLTTGCSLLMLTCAMQDRKNSRLLVGRVEVIN